MSNTEQVKMFVDKLGEAYPGKIFPFIYGRSEDMYRVYYEIEDIYAEPNAEIIGKIIFDCLHSKGVFNVCLLPIDLFENLFDVNSIRLSEQQVALNSTSAITTNYSLKDE